MPGKVSGHRPRSLLGASVSAERPNGRCSALHEDRGRRGHRAHESLGTVVPISSRRGGETATALGPSPNALLQPPGLTGGRGALQPCSVPQNCNWWYPLGRRDRDVGGAIPAEALGPDFLVGVRATSPHRLPPTSLLTAQPPGPQVAERIQ